MTKRAVHAPGVPHDLPFSPALVWGNMVFVSGQVGRDPRTGEVPPDIGEQTRLTLENVKALVEAAGSSLDNALQMTIYMTDMINEFAAMNAVFKTFFPGVPPARSTVGISHLAKPGLKIEIDLVAAKAP